MTATANTYTVPVLIVGAGPAGLTAAITLAHHGVPSLVVERRTSPSGLPRATVISTRTMELLRGWGLEDEVRAGGIDVELLGWMCDTLAGAAAGAPLALGLPTRAQSALISPTAPGCVPQDHLEPVLLRHLRSLEPARIDLGTELVAVDNRPEGVQAVVRDVETGEARAVHARYLLAADGAHSAVRHALGIAMRGPRDLAGAVTTLFRAPLWDLLGDHRYGMYDINHPEAGGIFLPAGPDRWLYGQLRPLDHEDLHDIRPATMTRRIRLASGVPELQPRIERIGSFSFTAQLAERFAHDSTFLIGDAAHRVTPRGGTGMNTAIHDGYDVGWKLSWVLCGWADPGLLDSYETERRPVAAHNSARSADPAHAGAGVAYALAADLGGRIPHVWATTAGGHVSTLDLLGDGLTLFTGPDGVAWHAAAEHASPTAPLAIQALDAIAARGVGVRSSGALLVRPDGAPVGAWHDDTNAAPALDDAVAAACAGVRHAQVSPRRLPERAVA